MNNHTQEKFSFLKPILILIFISLGLLLLYFNQNTIELTLGAFFILLGIIIFFKGRKTNLSSNLVSYDERSELTRLRGADLSFKFLFITINILIILFTLNPAKLEVFFAFLGPIMAVSIVIYFGYYYWNERMSE